LRVRQPAGNAA